MFLLLDPSYMLGGMDLSPLSHDAIALASLRDINRELLVISTSNVSDAVQAECDASRDHTLAAIYILDPLPDNSKRPLEERPVKDYRQAIAQSAGKFDSITDPKQNQLNRDDISRN